MNLHSSFPNLIHRFFLVIGVVVLAYVCTALVHAELYQTYQSWRFEHKVGKTQATQEAVVTAEPIDLQEGDLVGRLVISRIGVSVMVLQGVEEATLHLGAGHVPGTPLPGGDGNSAIAAHRDTFFRKLKAVRTGDRVRFSSVGGDFEYRIQSTEIVAPDDTRVIESHGSKELTLISCYPFYFVGAAPHRFIVHAIPVSASSLP
jgi:sortase A